MTTSPSSITRRALLQKISALSLAPVATPMALNLLSMANAAAQSAEDYKALVCVFMFGGNDHYNTVIPYDTPSHDEYYRIRKGNAIAGTPYEGIALTRNGLTATALSSTAGLPAGLQMALGPTMGGLKSVFDAGRAGILLNVGPLQMPTTKAQFSARSVPLPPKLFSHNDQQAYWQTAGQTEGGRSGWGGRTADLLLSQNSRAAMSCISVSGNTTYLAGKQALSYQVSSAGALTVNALKSNSVFGSSACAEMLRTLVSQTSPTGHVLETEHAKVMNRALGLYDEVNTALSNTPTELTNLFVSGNATSGANSLSQQLSLVARLLHQRQELGLKRQVFIVSLGRFDLHDNLAKDHPGLLQRVSSGLKEFDEALAFLGLSNQVTTFTASEFGRTLSSNGDGSDHGWGSHHFVMGGAVNGGRFFGEAPPIGTTHDQQVGRGSLLPSTSIEQMAAELARWFGVSDSDMSSVLPYAPNFDLHKLGLMRRTKP